MAAAIRRQSSSPEISRSRKWSWTRGPFPQTFGIDSKAGLYFAQSGDDAHLVIFNATGRKLKVHDFSIADRTLRRAKTDQILVHPDGGKLMLFLRIHGSPARLLSIEMVKQ